MILLECITAGVDLLARLQAQDRWQAARSGAESSGNGLLLAVGAGLVLLLIGGGILAFHIQRRRNRQSSEDLFHQQAENQGLNAQETTVLERIAEWSGQDPADMIAVEDVLLDSIDEYLGSGQFQDMPGPQRLSLTHCLGAIKAKLGFGAPEGDIPTSSRMIVEDAWLTVVPGSMQGEFRAKLWRRSQGHLLLKPENPIQAAPGDRWAMRFFDGECLWEFESEVTGLTDDAVVLNHCEEMRVANRRRFKRVPVRMSALVCDFAFRRDDGELTVPQFVEAKLLEVGGPGIKIKAPLTMRPRQRLLVVMELADGVVFQALGKVRQVQNPRGSLSVYGVELTELTPGEVSQLANLTNATAIQNQQDPANQPETAMIG